MTRGQWIAVGLLVALLMTGGGVAVAVAIDKRKMAALLREAFRRYSLPEAWGEAIGRVESNLTSSAVVRTGSDGARGGAFGPTQITAMTARAHGFTGNPEDFARDPVLAAEWTAKIMKAGNPLTIEDAGAWWNAGRARFAQLGPSHVTRTTYIPRLRVALGKSMS